MKNFLLIIPFLSKYITFFFLGIPLSICTIYDASAQIGGQYTFAFLKQSASARLTGLSKSQIAQKDDDLTIGYTNPSMYNALMHNGLSYNHDFLLRKNSFLRIRNSNGQQFSRYSGSAPSWRGHR